MTVEITLRLTLSILVVLLSNLVARAGLKGACAKVYITPPLGITLIGSQGKPSDAVMGELYAKAMVLGDGSNTIAIVCATHTHSGPEAFTRSGTSVTGRRTSRAATSRSPGLIWRKAPARS